MKAKFNVIVLCSIIILAMYWIFIFYIVNNEQNNTDTQQTEQCDIGIITKTLYQSIIENPDSCILILSRDLGWYDITVRNGNITIYDERRMLFYKHYYNSSNYDLVYYDAAMRIIRNQKVNKLK